LSYSCLVSAGEISDVPLTPSYLSADRHVSYLSNGNLPSTRLTARLSVVGTSPSAVGAPLCGLSGSQISL